MAGPISPERAVSIIESVAKTPKGYRRAHSRGLVTRGTFVAAPEAKVLTVAEHFRGGRIPCLVRFSNASGNPCAPDRMSTVPSWWILPASAPTT